MTVSITQRVRRILGLAFSDHDAANTYCDNLEAVANVSGVPQRLISIPIANLAAGVDLANFPLMATDVAVVLESVHVVADGAFAGVDASNTIVVAVKDGAGNTIVTVTFDDGTVPVDNGINDLGSLDATHKKLSAAELVKISITNGATADPPALRVLLTFHVGTS